MDPDTSAPEPTPSLFNYFLGFLLVGIAWGFTTPFIRRAAVNFHPPPHASLSDPNRSWISKKILKGFFAVVDLLKSPGYALPLVINLTGSIWFFLLVGKAGKTFGHCSSSFEKPQMLITCDPRVEPYSPHHKLASILVHSFGRMVG